MLVVIPKAGTVNLTIENPDLKMTANWLNPETSEFLDPVKIENHETVTLASPDTLHTWLVLVKSEH